MIEWVLIIQFLNPFPGDDGIQKIPGHLSKAHCERTKKAFTKDNVYDIKMRLNCVPGRFISFKRKPA